MTLDDFLRTLETLIEDRESRDDAPGEGNFGCEDCRNCNHCRFCIGCDSCEDCTYCDESIECMSCTQSKRCVGCEKVSYCEDCRECKASRYLTLCISCTDCVHCLACVGLEGGEFHVLNQKRTRKEYFALLRQVQELMQGRMVAGWRPPGIGLASEVVDALVAGRDVELSAAPWLEELRPPELAVELSLPVGHDPRELDYDQLAPRGDQLAPRGDQLAPRGDQLAPRGDQLAPRGDQLAPRGDGLAARERDAGYGPERGYEPEDRYAAREAGLGARQPGYAGPEDRHAGRDEADPAAPERGHAAREGGYGAPRARYAGREADPRRRDEGQEYDRSRERSDIYPEPDYEPPRRVREPRRPDPARESFELGDDRQRPAGRAHADRYSTPADETNDARYRDAEIPRQREQRDAWDPQPRARLDPAPVYGEPDAPHPHEQLPTQPFTGRRGPAGVDHLAVAGGRERGARAEGQSDADWDDRPLAREGQREDSRERTVPRTPRRGPDRVGDYAELREPAAPIELVREPPLADPPPDAPVAREPEPSSPWLDDARAQAQRRAKRGSLRSADRPQRKPEPEPSPELPPESTSSGSYRSGSAPSRTGGRTSTEGTHTHTGTGLRLGRKPKRKA